MADLPGPPNAGDDIVINPVMLYDETRVVGAASSGLYPWLVQLGKDRGGWYLPFAWERWLPSSWLATRTIKLELQNLSAGEGHPVYGFSSGDYLEVALVEENQALVFRSERYGVPLTWALLLHELPPNPNGKPRTLVHLRFRGRIAATGWQRMIIVRFGAFMDHISTAPMLAGLADRVERPHYA
ncbi:hypothetical protein BAUCODRAFT_126538 [Baudoinia panamericana UAMH 10762]|uniref:Uncharacterized protein n=1 Tax=Baudoinia panamericana (strain UAMH 10762) TaxID=717646 RepID=M2M4L7_BAUPA|nr:uncharacterized protein BAUCODRAFT_126538 [Baudoinia panamericana UAMH 10762]EMC91536.1 hypothetical protein BAUCODRAFT_126538 [Baudoinia panamericana UAMH 10762]